MSFWLVQNHTWCPRLWIYQDDTNKKRSRKRECFLLQKNDYDTFLPAFAIASFVIALGFNLNIREEPFLLDSINLS